MHPIAFQIGSLTIRWYGVMAALGFITAMFLLEYNRRFAKLSKDQCSTLLFLAMISGILGARIFYVVQFFHYYRDNLWNIIRIDQGGLVFYGGFLLALAVLALYCKLRKLDIIRVLDVFVPAMTAAHGLGRIGCFLNGCCYGKITSAWWGVTPPAGSQLAMAAGTLPLHPIQLVEAGENFLLCLLYCWMLRRVKRGVVISSYLIIYAVLRFVNETLRGDNVFYANLTPAQWICILLTVAGTGLLTMFLRRKDDGSEAKCKLFLAELYQ